MLAAIGVSSVDELFRDIPAGVRFGRELDVPPALAEADLTRHLEELAAKNVIDDVSFLGGGPLEQHMPPRDSASPPRRQLPPAPTPPPPAITPGSPNCIPRSQTPTCHAASTGASH